MTKQEKDEAKKNRYKILFEKTIHKEVIFLLGTLTINDENIRVKQA